MLLIHGPPGIGKTSLAGAVARATSRPILAFSLVGADDGDDALRALGDALGALPCGDEAAILEALFGLDGALLVADDVADDAALAAVERVVANIPDGRLLAVSEGPLDRPGLALGPLPAAVLGDDSGNPLWARLAGALGVPIEESLAALGDDLTLLAAFPCGLPRAAVPRLPSAVLRPDARDRAVLRRGVAAAITPMVLDPAPEAARRALSPLADLARGAHLAHSPDPRDILALRLLARQSRDPVLRAELLGAAARLVVACGQAGPALALLVPTEGAPYAALALYDWAACDVFLSRGETPEAWTRAESASEAFGSAGDAYGRAALWRRVADRLGERGDVHRAEEAWRRARQAARIVGDDTGVAAALRGAAALATSRGEWVGAGALHDEAAEAAGAGLAERTNLRLGELSLALVRGEGNRIRKALDSLEASAGDDVLLRANLWRRRADALLRAGDADGALIAVDRAVGLYGNLGEFVARGAALRLLGDICGVSGRAQEAREGYARALDQQMRVRDWRGLVRTLDHAAALEEHLGELDRTRMLRDQRAAVVRVSAES